MNDRPDPSKYAVNPDTFTGGSWSGSSNVTSAGEFAIRPDSTPTGQNMEGTENAWNKGFMNTFVKDYRANQEKGNSNLNWFRDKKDGVALWDDKDAGIEFGDVFYNGKKVENLYTTYGDDFADSVMRPMLLSAQEQANGVSLDARRKENTEQAAAGREQSGVNDSRLYKQQKGFESDTQAVKDSWDQPAADATTVVGGILGGAGVGASGGAALGAVAGVGFGAVPGAIIGGIAGGVIGGVGALLNRDSLQDGVARSLVRRDEAAAEVDETFGPSTGGRVLGRLMVDLETGGSILGQAANPLGNLVEGLADTETFGYGVQGDGKSGFYAMNDEGELERSGWWTAAHLAGTGVSMLGQFSTGIGALTFQAQMYAQIAGKAGGLVVTGGQSWDDATASYDPIFYDEENNFSALQGLAGLGSVGIDAAQLFVARGTLQGAAAAGKEMGAAGRLAGGKTTTRTGSEVLQGRKFDLVDGVAVKATPTLGMIAPSELTSAATVNIRALMARGSAAGGKLTPDELYRAAQGWALNAKTSTSALVNGFGEGLEEGVQTIFDEYSHGRIASGEEVWTSSLYGAAMGIGMTAGAYLGSKASSDKQFDQANTIIRAFGGVEIADVETWRAMPEADKKALLAKGHLVESVLKEAAQASVNDWTEEMLMTDPAMKSRAQAQGDLAEREAKSANKRLGSFTTVSIGSPDQADHVVVASINQAVKQTAAVIAGIQSVIEQGYLNPAEVKATQAVMKYTNAILDKLIDGQTEYYNQQTTEDRRKQIIWDLGTTLAQEWQLDVNDPESILKAKAVTMLMARFPADNPGSAQTLLLQLSHEESQPVEAGSTVGRGDNMVRVAMGPTQMWGADFDGDMLAQLVRLVMNDEQYINARIGTNLLIPTGKDAVGVPTQYYQEELLTIVKKTLLGGNSTDIQAAESFLKNMEYFLSNVYGKPLGMEEAVDEFMHSLRVRGTGMTEFFNRLQRERPAEMTELAMADGATNQWFRINTRMRRELWAFQSEISTSHAKGVSEEIQTSNYSPLAPETEMGRHYASVGANSAQTLWLAVKGANLFRKFQALNYSAPTSADETIENTSRRDDSIASMMTEFYQRINSKLLESKYAGTFDRHNPLQAVQRKLDAVMEILMEDGGEQMGYTLPLVMNMAMPNWNESRQSYDSQPTSLAAMLLRDEIATAEEFQKGIELDEFKMNTAKYKKATPAEAGIYVLEALELRQVLGAKADVFGNLTVADYFSQYTNQDTEHRQMSMRVLRSDASYTLPKMEDGKSNLPILKGTRAASEMTAYQAFVDMLEDAGNHRIAYDGSRDLKDQTYGRLADASNKTSKKLQAAITQLNAYLHSVPGFARTREGYAKVLSANPGLAASYLGMMSSEARIISLGPDGTTPKWLIDALMDESPERSELRLWQNFLTAEWAALDAGTVDDGTHTGRSFYNLKNRWHILFYKLAQPDMLVQKRAFEQLTQTASSVWEVVAWVNDPANGVRGNEAPYTAWSTDVAEIDSSYANGQLAAVLPGSTQRIHIREFHEKALQYIKGAKLADEHFEKGDAIVLQLLDEAILYPGKNSAADAALKSLDLAIKTGAEMSSMAGPAIFFDALLGSNLLSTNAADKGTGVTHMQSFGEVKALQKTEVFGVADNTVVASATTVSAGDVRARPRLLQTARHVQLEDGKTVYWPGMSAELFVKAYKNPDFRPALQAHFGLNFLERSVEGKISKRSTTDGSLQALTSDHPKHSAFFVDSRQANAQFVAAVDGGTVNNELMRYALALQAARSSANKGTISTAEQAGDVSMEVMMDLARAIKALVPLMGKTNNIAVNTLDVFGMETRTVPPTLLGLLKAQAQARLREESSKSKVSEEMQNAYKEILLALSLKVRQYRDESATPEERALHVTQIQALEAYQNSGTMSQVTSVYGLLKLPKAGKSTAKSMKAWEKANIKRLSRIANYIRGNHAVVNGAQWSLTAREVFRNKDNKPNGLPKLTLDQWKEMSGIVVVHEMQRRLGSTVPGAELFPATGTDPESLKYFDPEYSYIADIIDEDSPILKAAAKLMREVNPTGLGIPNLEVANNIIQNTLTRKGSIGPYTEAVTTDIAKAHGDIDSAAANAGISAGGSVTKEVATIMVATARTFAQPPSGSESKTRMSLEDLRAEKELGVVRPGGKSSIESLDLLEGRFVKSAKIFSPTGEFTYPLPGIVPSFGVPFNGDKASVKIGYRATSPELLRNSLEIFAEQQGVSPSDLEVELEFFHPDDQPLDQPNSLWFEGTSGIADQNFNSLVASQWLAPGGTAQSTSSRALEAAKKSLSALFDPNPLTEAERVAALADWKTEGLGVALRRLASIAMEDERINKSTSGAAKRIDPVFGNAMSKLLRLLYVARLDMGDGTYDVISSEQVLAMQSKGEDVSAYELVPISRNSLATLLGDSHVGASIQVPIEEVSTNIWGIEPWRGIFTKDHKARQKGLWDATPVDPMEALMSANRVGVGELLTMPSFSGITEEKKSRYAAGTTFRAQAISDIKTARANISNLTAKDLVDSGKRVNSLMGQGVTSYAGADALKNLQLPVNVDDPDIRESAEQFAQNETKRLIASQEGSAAHIVHFDKDETIPSEFFHIAGWEGINRPGDNLARHVAPGETALLLLDQLDPSSTEDSLTVRETLDRLIGAQARVALHTVSGRSWLQTEAREFLLSHGYQEEANNRNYFIPAIESQMTAGQRGNYTRAVDGGAISTEGVSVVLQVEDNALDENAAIAIDPDMLIESEANILPANLAGFGRVPEAAVERVEAEIQAAAAQLRERNLTLDKTWSEAEKGSKEQTRRAQELNKSFDRAMERLTARGVARSFSPTVGDTIEIGDFYVRYRTSSRTIALYRHGHKLPDPEGIDEQLADNGKFILYSPELDPNLLANEGTVTNVSPMGTGATRVTMRARLQLLGAKFLTLGTGFKSLTVSPPKGWYTKFPELWPGRKVAVIVKYHDADGKGNKEGVANNFQEAFTWLGIDFRPYLARLFYGNDSEQAQADAAVAAELLTNNLAKYSLSTALVSAENDLAVSANIQAAIEAAKADNKIRDFEQEAKDNKTTEARIFNAMLAYMNYSEAKIENVLFSSGISHPSSIQPKKFTRKMDSLFTQFFDRTSMDDQLRTDLVKDLQRRFPNKEVAADGRKKGYILHNDFSVTVSGEKPGEELKAFLQFSRLASATANPVTKGQAQDKSDTEGANAQMSSALASHGLRLSPEKNLPKLQRLMKVSKDLDLTTKGAQSKLFGSIPSEQIPNILAARSAGERAMIHSLRMTEEAMVRQPLDMSDMNDGEVAAYLTERARVGGKVGLTQEESVLLDILARQLAGRPAVSKRNAKKLKPEELEAQQAMSKLSYGTAMDMLKILEENFDNGEIPITGGAISQMHLLDLRSIWEASHRAGDKFMLLRDPSDKNSGTMDFAEWIAIAFAVGNRPMQWSDYAYLRMNDAMRISYMEYDSAFAGIPVSHDDDMNAALLSGELPTGIEWEELVSSDPRRRAALKNELIINKAPASQSQVPWTRNSPGTSRDQKTLAIYQWRKENQKGMVSAGNTSRNLVKYGNRIIQEDSNMMYGLRVALNIRAALALADPRLALGAVWESTIQTALDDIADLATGYSSAPGVLGTLLAKGLEAGTLGAVKLITISKEQQQNEKVLRNVLGRNPIFQSLIHDETEFVVEKQTNKRLERWSGKAAEAAGALQNVTAGMNNSRPARTYISTVLRTIDQMGDLTSITREYATEQLKSDPLWVQKNVPLAHQFAMNQLRNTKMIKDSVLSLTWGGALDTLSESPRFMVQVPAVMFLKMKHMFQRYGFASMLRITGLQGADALVAALFTGKEKGSVNKFYHNVLSFISGSPYEPIDGEEIYDFTATMESVDVAHTVVKSGVSMTSLFAFAMIAGGFGLGGGDDEEKRLRKIAKFTGAPYMYDPRDIANDFRNADNIYLDNVPYLSDMFRVTVDDDENGIKGRSMAEMNFLLKQIMSPILGMDRFMENGNPYEILWGFYDAIGSLPLVSTMRFDDATKVYAELMTAATDEQATGGPDSLPTAYRYMINAVMNLERMLLESNFINSIYVGSDKYDRDPWLDVATHDTGEVLTDGLGNPQASDSLNDYVNDEGEVAQGFVNRDWMDAQHHDYAEKRLGVALLSNLVMGLGGDADYLRKDQVIKTRKIEKDEIPLEEADAIIRALWKGGVSIEDIHAEGFYMSYETRQALYESFKEEIVAEGIESGLSEKSAEYRFSVIWKGPVDNVSVMGLNDLVWDGGDFEGKIGYTQSDTYNQLNTTYTLGPDGKYWATGVSRNLMTTLLGFNPLTRYLDVSDTGLPLDSRLNVTDPVRNANLGLRALEAVPTDAARITDPNADIIDAIEKAGGGDSGNGGNGYEDWGDGNGWQNWGSGWKNYGSGWKNYGSGGGYSSGGSFTKLYAPEGLSVPYANTADRISTNNPIIRRASLRRERADSSRGRLKPWQ